MLLSRVPKILVSMTFAISQPSYAELPSLGVTDSDIMEFAATMTNSFAKLGDLLKALPATQETRDKLLAFAEEAGVLESRVPFASRDGQQIEFRYPGMRPLRMTFQSSPVGRFKIGRNVIEVGKTPNFRELYSDLLKAWSEDAPPTRKGASRLKLLIPSAEAQWQFGVGALAGGSMAGLAPALIIAGVAWVAILGGHQLYVCNAGEGISGGLGCYVKSKASMIQLAIEKGYISNPKCDKSGPLQITIQKTTWEIKLTSSRQPTEISHVGGKCSIKFDRQQAVQSITPECGLKELARSQEQIKDGTYTYLSNNPQFNNIPLASLIGCCGEDKCRSELEKRGTKLASPAHAKRVK